MLNSLREATRQLHADIEKDNLAGLIMEHDITLQQYKLLLLQNYIAYKFTEGEIAKYLPEFKSSKSTRLKMDLENLHVATNEEAQFSEKFSCNSYHQALGAAYVVEGSALGGMQIAKELENCQSLKNIEQHYFFNGDRKNIKQWNAFVKTIKAQNFTQEQISEATEKAEETFRFFGEVFRKTFKNRTIA